ncbi:MAG: putative manganese-dependent inorganic diphosphatase [Lachnospiraceae bacterium]|nr:putative manganese-dependent inorganic diphosphatase [Lachnospiraceae bacterium]MEE3460941.1 putative manganese-dependent inorganic diphosphatase [Lachnospiraceae bacterium]
MFDKNRKQLVRVIGHKNPDTDSICSAIALAYLKNHTDSVPYEARRAGEISRETAFVLSHFGFSWPRLSENVSPTLYNVDIRIEDPVTEDISLRKAWKFMEKESIDTLCVTNEEDHIRGIITIKDIARANLNIFDSSILSASHTSIENIVETLEGTLLLGDPEEKLIAGNIVVGSSPESMKRDLKKGDIVILTNNLEDEIYAIEAGASVIIVCMEDDEGKPDILVKYGRENDITVIQTPLDTYAAVRLICMAAPVSYFMSKNTMAFHINTPVEDVKATMAKVRYKYFPVLDAEDMYIGMVSRRNILNVHKKKVILVDHNERSQAVDGLEDAEILAVIDHHRIGTLETGGPVYFRNEPVGCTATIIYRMFLENSVDVPEDIAGLLLSAILSDTLIFHSPTCTKQDIDTASSLARICEENIQDYGRQMFEAGENLTGRTGEDLMNTDCKEFNLGEFSICVAQGFFMSKKAYDEAKVLIKDYMNTTTGRDGVNMQFFMLTSIETQGTLLLFEGNGADRIVADAFNVEVNDHEAILPGVVSRKKQLIPPLRDKIISGN